MPPLPHDRSAVGYYEYADARRAYPLGRFAGSDLLWLYRDSEAQQRRLEEDGMVGNEGHGAEVAMLVDAYTGVMNSLLLKLSKLMEDENVKIKGVVRNQVTFLRDEFSSMKPVLEMLADVEELDPLMKEWWDNMRELAYDIEDFTDSFMARVNHGHDELPTGFKGFFRKLKKLKARNEIAAKIEELKTSSCAMEASRRHKKYNIVDLTSTSSTCGIDPRLLALNKEMDKLVGLDQMADIIDWSIKERDDKNLKALAVVGSPGLGDTTTLAKRVYDRLEDKFQSTAFVPASRNLCIETILRCILSQVGIIDNTSDVEVLIVRIRCCLKDKRFLIVVDDVPTNGETWKAMKRALFNLNGCGSTIITTTSNAAVASCCSSDGGCVYQLKPLSFDDSKRLFFKRAFGSDDLPYLCLERVLDGILSKCGGLPLATIIISSWLANQHAEDEWNRVLSTISCAFANNPDVDRMTKILSLCYFDLPCHLRTCLLSLSIFPEDHEINKRRLINRWIAEGFIQEEQEHGPVSEHRTRVRRLFVDNNRNKNDTAGLMGLIPSHVRSLTIYGKLKGTCLLSFPALHVLDLDREEHYLKFENHDWEFDGLENYLKFENHEMAKVEKLSHLRYLRLCSPNFYLNLAEGIGDLQYMEILDIEGTTIVDLPPAITRLHRLSRLYVSRFVRFPDGVIGNMQSLEELDTFGVTAYEHGKKRLQEFSQLTKLRALKVTWDFDWSFCQSEEGLQYYVQNLISSCNLHHLYITNVRIWPAPYPLSLESCRPTTGSLLQKLHITYCFICKLPNWIGSLCNLRELKLYIYCIRPEDIEILGAIPSLVFLKLKTFYGSSGRIFIPGHKGFRCLKYFGVVMMSCGTAVKFEAGSMPQLEHLKLRFCLHKVECLNGASDFGIQHLSTLNVVEVHIYGCLADHKEYDPEVDKADSNVRCVTRLVKAASGALPNHPACSFELARNYGRLGPFHGLIETCIMQDEMSEEEEEELMVALSYENCGFVKPSAT
ncbi:hypothetical protein U9M48_012748 [Paspalum notatum var. saurae]|uniref:Uncharacterized protein n=1 Tax=Paspalum notatum var. saurae TaxID=547442 RepID=A0AAQ3SY57_PASNO